MTLPAAMGLDPMEDVFLQDGFGPSIAEHASQCSQLFEKYMAVPNLVPDPTLMDDQRARFTLWASNMDVFGPLNVSLDYRLRYSPTVVEIIHQLLNVIANSLTSLRPIDDPPHTLGMKKQRISKTGYAKFAKRVDDDSSDTDSGGDQAQKNISLITYTIGGTVMRLFSLSNAIRKSAKASRIHKIGEYKDDEEANNAIAELRLYTDCYIRFRFPQAPETLRSALVEANALRLRRLCYQRSHRRRVALSIQRSQADRKTVQLPKMLDGIPAVRFAPNVPTKVQAVDEGLKPTGLPLAPVTYATTAQQTAVRALYADSMVEVPRAKSVLVNNKLSFPPVPTSNECPYCGVIIKFKGTITSILWNNHVIRDLEPFSCMFTHCTDSSQQKTSPLTFETSKVWTNHMQNAHGLVWECRAPSHDPTIFEKEVDYQEHSRKEHGVSQTHVGTLSDAARRPALQRILACPFGDEFSAPEKAEPSTVFANEALHLHVAAHMKEIALLALQKIPSDDDGKSEDVTSDQPVEDSGFAKLRGSMYSVLDDESLNFSGEAEDDVSKTHAETIDSTVDKLDLEDKDAAGLTKLHRAVFDNDLPLARSLVEQGASLHCRTRHGKTALHFASLFSKDEGVDMMKMLLDCEFSELLNLRDDNGQTPLHFAARSFSTAKIEILISHGADIAIVDDYGFSAYLWAVIAGSQTATEYLLSLGTDVNSASADGKSALSWAASLGHSRIVRLLVDRGADVVAMAHNTPMVPLEQAAAFGDFATVEVLLEAGADPNHRDREGWSAIHWAAEQGFLNIVELLLKSGADVNAISSYGTSALHCAANGGHQLVVVELLHCGADPSKSTCHGWTPLHHAAFKGHSDTVTLLLHVNDGETAPCNSQDNHGWSALHLAVHGRHLAIVRTLLNSSIAPEFLRTRDEDGLTAEEWLDFEFDRHSYKTVGHVAFGKSRCCNALTTLRQAVRDNQVALTEFFLEQGQDPNTTDSGSRTALYYAAKNHHIGTLKMLLEVGADPNLLPTGRKAWEEFIYDDDVLQRLRKAGYVKPSPDPRIDYEISREFRERRKRDADPIGNVLSPTQWPDELLSSPPPPQPRELRRTLLHPPLPREESRSGLSKWLRPFKRRKDGVPTSKNRHQ